MTILPPALLDSLHGVAGFDAAAFNAVHQSGAQITSIRINPAKPVPDNASTANQSPPPNDRLPFALTDPVPWSRFGFYLPERPSFTFDPLFHAGCYYVQEASGMFLEQALLQTVDVRQPLRVLDLCAAPGGKSTHLQSLLSADSLLVSNEVIRNRAGILKENCMKWGAANVVVTNNDPQHFARLDGFFDVLVADAPCSGSGLFRRDAAAVSEWSEAAVQLCGSRQKRILTDALPALKEAGILIYATCSFSAEEDEDIGDWLLQTGTVEPLSLELQPQWNIVESRSRRGAVGYRFFPDKLRGEGFYLSVFRKIAPSSYGKAKEAVLEKATVAEKTIAARWLRDDGLELFRFPTLYGLLKKLVAPYAVVKKQLNVIHAGVTIGDVMNGKLVPAHALALSGHLSPEIPTLAVDRQTAIRYLQRADVKLQTKSTGWHTVRYNGHNMGWVNALPNRINNYYPKEWRILKQHEG